MADNEFTLPMDYEPTEDISVNAVQATEDPGKFLQEGSGPAIVETSLDKVSDAGTASQDWLVESFAQAATGTFNTPDLWKNRKPTTVEEIGRSLVHGFAGPVKSTLSGVVKTAAYAEAAMEDAEHGLAELIVGRSFPNRNFGRALIHSMNEQERSEAWERTLYENRQGIKSDAWYNMLASAFGSSAALFGAAVKGVPAKTLSGAEGLMIGASYFSEQSSKLESAGESGAKALPFAVFIGTLGGLIAKTGGEAIISDAVQSKFGPAAVSFARGATDNLVKRISKRLLNPVAKKAAKAEAIEELAQEASTIGTEKIQDAVLGTQVNQSTWQEDTQRMFVGLAGGATVGGLVGEYVYNKNLNKLQKKLEPVFEGDKNKSFEAATAIADAVLNEVAAENAAVKSLEGHVADLNPELAQVLSHVFEDLVNQGFVDFRQATPDEVRQAGLDWANLMSAAAILDAMERNIPLRTHPLFKAIAEIDRILLEGRDPSTGDLLPLDINNAQVRELANQIEDYIEQNRETRQAEEASKLAALREADMRARQETIQELERAAIAELEKEQAANNQERITELQQQITELQHQMDLLREERSKYIKERAAQGRISIGRAKAQTAPDNKTLTKKAIRSGNLDIITQILQDNGFKTRDLSGTQIKQMAQLNWEMFAGKDLGTTKSKYDQNVAMKAIQQNVVSGDAVLLRAGYTQGQIDQMDDKTWNRALQAAYREETEALESAQQQLTPEQLAQIPDDMLYQDLAAENARLDDIYPAYTGETINIDGKERTVYNSNGERIAQSEPALRNFYKWFGDSKVVDDQGRPLVVYHGTKDVFDTFETKRDNRYDSGQLGTGFYFTDSKESAEDYADWKRGNGDKIVMPLYVKIEKPLVLEKDTERLGTFGRRISKQLGIKIPESASLINQSESDAITEKATSLGYNGVIAETNFGETYYVAFEPNQIKSTQNRGTFSPNTGDIYYQNQVNPEYTGETINIDGVERTVYNSNGERIAKSEPALRNFWNWFGDSKVVDDKGRPLVVYHGSDVSGIEVFDNQANQTKQRQIGADRGYFFTDSKKVAERFRTETQRKAETQYYMENTVREPVDETRYDAQGRPVGTVHYVKTTPAPYKNFGLYGVYLKAENINEFNGEEIGTGVERDFALASAKANEKDGVIIYNADTGAGIANEYIVFEPTQIKSTQNRGTFSPDTGDIYYQNQLAAQGEATLFQLPPELAEQAKLAEEMARLDAENDPYKGETINIDGVEQPTKNSEDNPIAKSEPALRNFWNWFGDSKVVDKDGRPLVVYHGTGAEFDTFLQEKVQNTSEGYGFYFIDNQSASEGFGKNVVAAYLKIENPVYAYSQIFLAEDYDGDLDIMEANDEMVREAVQQVKAELESKGYDFYPQVQADLLDNFSGSSQTQEVLDGLLDMSMYIENEDFDREQFLNDVREAEIKAFGIDGYRTKGYAGGLGTVYVPFMSNQIKSTENTGEFGIGVNDIYHQPEYVSLPVPEMIGGKFDKSDKLVVSHGISLNSINKALALGGLPSPSIAISKASDPLTDFGTIKLVGTKEMIDPENEQNLVYDRDIWSAMFPRPVYKNATKTASDKFRDKFRNAFIKADEEDLLLNNILYLALNSANPGQVVDMFANSFGAQIYYLEHILGKTIDVPMTERYDLKDIYFLKPDQRFIDEVAKIDINESYDAWKGTFRKAANDLIAREGVEDRYQNIISRVYEYYDDLSFPIAVRMVQDIKNYAQNNGLKVNRLELQYLLDAYNLYGDKNYEKWASEQTESLLGEPKIKVGNKKLDWTLDNITKAMIQKSVVNSATGGYSIGNIIAAGGKKLESLEEIKSEGRKLKTKADSEAETDSIGRRITEFASDILSQFEESGNSTFDSSVEDVYRALVKAANLGSITESTLNNLLNKALEPKERINFDKEVLKEGVKFTKEISGLTRYFFEAKPQRSVRFEEFVGAIVPPDALYDEVAANLVGRGLVVIRTDDIKGGVEAIEQIKQGTVFQNKKTSKSTTGLGTEHRGGYDPMTKAIIFNKTSDLTTLFHESAHYWFDRNLRYYRTGLASPEWKKKWEDVMNELGATPNARGTIPVSAIRSASEKFARSMEAYLREGKYESAAIQWAHQDYANMVKRVYRNIWATYWGLNDLSPAVKQWFDMFGLKTDDATTAFAEEDKIETDEQMVGAVIAEDATKPDVDTETKAIVADAGAQVVENPATQEIAVVPADPFETGKKARSKLPRSAEAATGVSMDDIIYNRRSMSDAFKAAQQLVNTDPVRAWEILKGGQEMVDGLYAGDIYRALIAKYQAENNPIMLKNVVQAFAGAARRAGRSVKAFDLESPRISFEKTINSLDKIFDTKKNDKRIEKVKNELKEFLHDPSALRVGWEEFKNIVGCK